MSTKTLRCNHTSESPLGIEAESIGIAPHIGTFAKPILVSVGFLTREHLTAHRHHRFGSDPLCAYESAVA